MVAKHPGRVRFASENFGESKLAERFGVKRYPAVFVNDALVARPRDFGFFGGGERSGRYTPWRSAASQQRFKADLARMVELALAGRRDEIAREVTAPGARERPDQPGALPKFDLADLSGRPLNDRQLAGRVVLVELWATWCPPCRSTLEWLRGLKRKRGDDVVVVALAVESPADQVHATAALLGPELRWAVADAPTALAFGDVVAVPTLMLFDRAGRTARVLYGAPPDLHQQAEQTLAALIEGSGAGAAGAAKRRMTTEGRAGPLPAER